MNRGRSRSQRPNRGGGRFNTRALLRALIEHDKDEVEVSEGNEQSEEQCDDFVAENRQTTTEKSSTTPGKTRRRSSNKALIQRLHMSIENQQLVEEVLRRLKIHVHRDSHDFQENLDLSSREMKRNEAYWRKVGERKLVDEGAVHFENEEEIMNCFKMTPSEYSLPVKKSIVAPDIGLVENGARKKGASIMKPKIKKLQQPSEELTIQEKNRMLKQQFERLQSVAAYKSMLEERKKLPAWKSQQNITGTLKETQVVVISGMTGCGKTTQIPQFILDSFIEEGRGGECFIICTQPRRISALSVAERVSAERIDKIGESVGYQVRLESKQSSRTSLLYCTTGILLRRLEGESSLPGVSHVIVDEVHERTEEG